MWFALTLSLLSVVGYSYISILIGKITQKYGAFWTGFWIQFLGLCMTLLFLPFFRFNLSFSLYLLPLAIFGTGIAFTYILYCKNLSIGPPSVVQSILTLSNLITFILAILVFHENISILKALGGIIVISGVILVSLHWEELRKRRIQTMTKAVPLTLLQATINGVIFLILSIGTKHFNGFSTSIGTRLFTVPTFFILSSIQPKQKVSLIQTSGRLIGMIVFIDVVSYILYNTAIEKYDVSFVTLIQSTQPVVTALLAYFFFQERLTWLQRIGILTTVTGSMLFMLR